ncbi:MAG: hypothetical protein IPJ49_26280 [Candidatus Obscuribacter sp.]|nr:hypothetical protein [Candidatus Obscuribacter sp.]
MVANDAPRPNEAADTNVLHETRRQADLSSGTWQDMKTQPRLAQADLPAKTPGYDLPSVVMDFSPAKSPTASLQDKLLDHSAKPEERLQAVRELAKQGVTTIKGVDDQGHETNLRLEVAKSGNREMVHLFVNQDGKEKTALRGILNEGKIEQQRDKKGHAVSFEGKGIDAFNHIKVQDNKSALPKLDITPDAPKPAYPLPEGKIPVPATKPDNRFPLPEGNIPVPAKKPELPEPRLHPDKKVESPAVRPGWPRTNGDQPLPWEKPAQKDADGKTPRFKLEPVTDRNITSQVPGAMYLGVKGSIRAMENGKPVVKHDQKLWLAGDAARGLERAQEILDAQGKGKRIELRDLNSAGRLHDAQIAIAKAAPNQVHARPGRSAHEIGKSVDINNYADKDVANALLKAGFRYGNHGKVIANDPVHFTFHGTQKSEHVASHHRRRR